MATAVDVAQWMLAELRESGFLRQQDAVYDIERNFGKEFVYENDRGNMAIERDVLDEFKTLTGNSVVWERGERIWRFREEYDDKDKRQQE